MTGVLVQLTTTKGHCLKGLAECLKEIGQDALMRFSAEGLMIRSSAIGGTCMADVKLDAKDIPLYVCSQPLEVGIDMVMLFRVLKNVSGEEEVTLKITRRDADCMYVIIDNSRKQIRTTARLRQLVLNPENYGQPDFTYNMHVRMLSAHFRDMCRDMVQVAKEMHIVADPATDKLVFSCAGMCVDLQVDLLEDEPTENQEKQQDAEQPSKLVWQSDTSIDERFSLHWLVSACKAAQAPLGTIVELFLGAETPMMMRFGLGDLGTITYCLAPKLPDEACGDDADRRGRKRRPMQPPPAASDSSSEDGSQNSRRHERADGQQEGLSTQDQYVG